MIERILNNAVERVRIVSKISDNFCANGACKNYQKFENLLFVFVVLVLPYVSCTAFKNVFLPQRLAPRTQTCSLLNIGVFYIKEGCCDFEKVHVLRANFC